MMRFRCVGAGLVLSAFLCGDAFCQQSSPEAAQQYSAAVALQNQQLYDLAADEWQAFLKAHPDHELAQKAQYYLGVCRFQQADYRLAERAFAAATAGGRFKLLGSAYLNLGLAQFNQSQQAASGADSLQRAIKTFEQMAQRVPEAEELEEAMFYLAEAQYAAGDAAAALTTYHRTLRQFPQHPRRLELLYGLGTTAAERDKSRTAKDAFSKIVSMSGSDRSKAERALIREAQIRLADLLLAEGSAAKAQRLLEAASADQRGTLADYALLRLAESHFVSEQYDQAARAFEQVVSQFPKSEYRVPAIVGAGKSRLLGDDAARAVAWLTAQQAAIDREHAAEAAHWLARGYLAAGTAGTGATRRGRRAEADGRRALATAADDGCGRRVVRQRRQSQGCPTVCPARRSVSGQRRCP